MNYLIKNQGTALEIKDLENNSRELYTECTQKDNTLECEDRIYSGEGVGVFIVIMCLVIVFSLGYMFGTLSRY